MNSFIIYFSEDERSRLVNALETFCSIRKIVYSFGQLVIDDDDNLLEFLRPLLTRRVCFVSCPDLDDSLRFGDFLRALKFRFSSF